MNNDLNDKVYKINQELLDILVKIVLDEPEKINGFELLFLLEIIKTD